MRRALPPHRDHDWVVYLSPREVTRQVISESHACTKTVNLRAPGECRSFLRDRRLLVHSTSTYRHHTNTSATDDRASTTNDEVQSIKTNVPHIGMRGDRRGALGRHIAKRVALVATHPDAHTSCSDSLNTSRRRVGLVDELALEPLEPRAVCRARTAFVRCGPPLLSRKQWCNTARNTRLVAESGAGQCCRQAL